MISKRLRSWTVRSGALIGRYKQVDQRGKVAICSPSRTVARLIEMSGLLRIISMYRDEQEALKKI